MTKTTRTNWTTTLKMIAFPAMLENTSQTLVQNQMLLVYPVPMEQKARGAQIYVSAPGLCVHLDNIMMQPITHVSVAGREHTIA